LTAINPKRPLADLLQIHRRAQGAADEPLNLLGTTVNFAFGAVARFAFRRGVGEHGILRGEPAAGDFLLLHPARHSFLNGHAANHARIAPFNERGAGGVGRNVILEAQRAKLVGGATVGAGQFSHKFNTSRPQTRST
jgi:hypothetical protein